MSEAVEGKDLDQLPKAVLKKITSLIPEQNDVNVRLICKTFKELFDETIGVSWGKYCYADEPKTKIEDFEELPSCRSFALAVESDVEDDDLPISIPKFKSKRLLKSVELGKEVTDSSLNRLLTGLTSLENLTLYQRAISNLACSLYIKDLTNLKEICLYLFPAISDRLYFKLINFLKLAQFQNLQILDIEVENPICENIFCDALLTFLIQHQKSLTKLWITMWGMRQDGQNHRDWPNLPDFSHRLNQLETPQIVEVSMLNIYFYKSTKFAEIFDKIIKHGKKIKEADECPILYTEPDRSKFIQLYDNYDEQLFYTMLKPLPAQMILNNCTTLVRIGMKIIPEDCQPLDCSIFNPCKSLKEIRLLTRRNSDAKLVNVIALPQALKEFEVSNFLLKSEEIHSIATSNIGLKCIFLGKAGTENGYGATTSSFASFITRRTQKLYIIDSWNLDDFMESLNHHGPLERIQALTLLQSKKVKDGNRRYVTVFTQPLKPKRICMKISSGSNTYEEVEVESASD